MIQRPQTLYFLAIAVLALMMIFSDISFFTIEEQDGALAVSVEYDETKITADEQNETMDNQEMVYSLAVIAALALFGLFSFKKRPLQVSLTSFNFLAILILIALMYYYSFSKDYIDGMDGELTFSALLPVALLFFNFLALRGIRRDINLIRSMDRFR